MKPKVSVIMTTYKEPENYLRQAIESILNQTFKNFEFIIVLDNPNNKLHEKIIKEYEQKEDRIVFIKNERNLGRGASRNKAILVAKGKYIAILDADDIALKNRLEKQYNYLKKNKDIDFLFSWVYYIDEYGNIIKEFKPNKNKVKNIKNYIFKEHLLIHPSMMVKAEVIKKLKYDKNLKRSQDFDLWLRAIAKGYEFDIINEFLLKYRIYRNTYDERINRQINYSKYTIKSLWKNKKYFYNSLNFWKRFFYELSLYIFIKIMPRCCLYKIIKIKNKK